MSCIARHFRDMFESDSLLHVDGLILRNPRVDVSHVVTEHEVEIDLFSFVCK